MRRLLTSLAIITLTAFNWAVVAIAGDGTPPCTPSKPRPQDQIWLVSTRNLDCVGCRLSEAPVPCIWKYDAVAKSWQTSTVARFLATDDPTVPTNFFVHGNWIDFEESVEVAFTYFGYQVTYAPSDRPLRLVIWSWPSTRGRHPLRNVRSHYARTDTEGAYLAWFAGSIDPRVHASYVGYSFGAPVVTGALHHLAVNGGAVVGEARPNVARVPGRAVLIAAAECDGVLAVGSEHELALSQVDRMLVLVNGCDPALKWFRFVDKCARCDALGYRGVAGSVGGNAGKVRQVEASSIVGAEHYWLPYVSSQTLIEEMIPYIWFDDVWRRADKSTTIQGRELDVSAH